MSISVDVKANASQAIEALGRVRDRTTDLERGLNKIQTSFKNFGSLATKSITIPIVASTTALSLATKSAINFNKQMAEVNTLLPNISKNGFEKLKKDTLALSSEMGIASEKVIPALYQAISAGVPSDNVISFLEVAGKSAIAGVTEIETSVDGLTSVVNAYGSDILGFNEASDTMFTTVKLGKTTFEELSKSLYNVVPTASSLGVSFNDVSAALATITTQGTPTSVATTQLRAALVELSKEGSTTDKIFRELAGKSFQEFIASGGNLNDALQLIEKYSNETGKSLKGLFSSGEAGDAVLQLTGKSVETFSNSLKEMKNSANATETAFNTMELTEARQFEKLMVEVQNLVTSLGQELIPVVQNNLLPLFKDNLIPIAEKLITSIGALLAAFNKMPTSVKNTTLVTVGLAAALGPALIAISSMKDGMSLAVNTIGGMKKATEVLIIALKNKNTVLKASAVAWQLLNNAIMLTPIGLLAAIAVALGVLTAHEMAKANADKKLREETIKLANATKIQADAFISLSKETEKLTERYIVLSEQAKLTSEEQAEHAGIIERLKVLYPELSITYDENGNVMSNLVKDIDALRQAKRSETLETIQNTKAELENLISKQKSKVDALKNKPKVKDNPNSTNIMGAYGANARDEHVLEGQEEILKNLQDRLNETAGSEKELASQITKTTQSRTTNIISTGKTTQAINTNTTSNKSNSKSLKEREKNYGDYVKELEGSLQTFDKQEKQLKSINKEYENSNAIEQRKSIIVSSLETMTSELTLTEAQIESLAKKYGDAFDAEKIESSGYKEMRAEIYENVKAYESELSIRRQLGEEIDVDDEKSQKSEIVKMGILSMNDALKLTGAQVVILKKEFEKFFETTGTKTETLGDWMKENWQDVTNKMLNFTSDMAGSINDLYSQILQNQIDSIDKRKNAAIEALDKEYDEYLKNNKLTEKTEAKKIKENIKELKDRQKVALGLYEQERLRKEIEEQEADLKRVMAEEEKAKKLQEINKKYENEKLLLQHKMNMSNWKSQLVQATASGAQAIVNAVVTGMASPLPFFTTPLLTTMAASLTGVQIATIAASKPQEPELLAQGGVIRRRVGGIQAIIGEGHSNEAVIPLKDDVLASIGESMAIATRNKEIIQNKVGGSENIENNFYVNQPMLIQIDGRTLYASILRASKRGIKVVDRRGIIN